MPWSLLPIAGKLIGGVIDSRRQKRAAERERATALEDDAQKFVRLRDAAIEGGFNPLTALQYNFGANMPSGVAAPLSVTNLFGEAAKGVADWATGKTAADNQRQILEDRLLQLEIERSEAALSMAANIQASASSGFNSSGGGVGRAVATSGLVGPSGLPVPTSEIGGINIGGIMVPVDPNATPAEMAEQQWGEFGGAFVGASNMIADIGALPHAQTLQMLGFNVDPNGPAARAYDYLSRNSAVTVDPDFVPQPRNYSASPVTVRPAPLAGVGGGGSLLSPLTPDLFPFVN